MRGNIFHPNWGISDSLCRTKGKAVGGFVAGKGLISSSSLNKAGGTNITSLGKSDVRKGIQKGGNSHGPLYVVETHIQDFMLLRFVKCI